MSDISQPVRKEEISQKIFDFAIAWDWEYDRDFVFQVHDYCLQRNLKPYLVQPFNLNETLQLISEDKIKFRVFFDRVADTDFRFQELVQLLQNKGTFFINDPDKIKWIDDKVLIHMDLTFHKIPVPPTFIYYPHDGETVLINKIKQIGVPFVVKPAHGVETGGMGVLINGYTVEDIYQWQRQYKDFIFLIQKQIIPFIMNEKPAWFRVFYILEKIIACWWNPSTHVYEAVTKADVETFNLKPLYTLAERIEELYKLGLFSTEIAVDKTGDFVVVDYINDQCDMRKKSKFADGVCDEIVDLIVNRLVEKIQEEVIMREKNGDNLSKM